MIRDINQIALRAFRYWLRAVKKQKPDAILIKHEELHIVLDVKQALNEALDAVHKEYGLPEDPFDNRKYLARIEGHVMGKLAASWSYKYVTPPTYYDYLMWIKAFRMTATMHKETRIRMNRMFTLLKIQNPSIGSVTAERLFNSHEEVRSLQRLTDLQVENNWLNFESLFQLYFEEDTMRLCDTIPVFTFDMDNRLFTDNQLERIYEKWKKRKNNKRVP